MPDSNYHARARMASVVSQMADRISRLHPATKSVNEVVRQYQDALENLVVDAANGNLKTAGFRSKHNSLIDDLAREAYSEGAREGGLDPDELDSDDDEAINSWRLDQFQYVLQFAKDAVAVSDLKGDARIAARDVMLGRVDNWVLRLKDLASAGYARAIEGELAYWELGNTEVHCDSCLAGSRAGKKRMKKWLDGDLIPRSSDLDCTGIHCDCSLRSVKTNKVLYPVY